MEVPNELCTVDDDRLFPDLHLPAGMDQGHVDIEGGLRPTLLMDIGGPMFHYMSWLEIWLVYYHSWLMAPWMYQQKWLVRHFRFPETKTEE